MAGGEDIRRAAFPCCSQAGMVRRPPAQSGCPASGKDTTQGMGEHAQLSRRVYLGQGRLVGRAHALPIPWAAWPKVPAQHSAFCGPWWVGGNSIPQEARADRGLFWTQCVAPMGRQQIKNVFVLSHKRVWSSGYDVRLTRERS
jgi:hypothetical protein